MPYPPNLCASVQSVGVFVGGYGIPAIPTLPSEFLPQNPLQVCLRKSSHRIHRIHRNFWRRIASHRLHRCRRVWHSCHTHAALQIPSTEPTLSLLAQVLPQNSQNTQKLQAEDILPRISQMYTESSGGEEPPTDFTDVHRFFFSASRFCVFREFCGKIVWWLRRVLPRISQNTQKLLAEKSLLQMRTDTHRWLGCVGFCGNIVWWLRGYGRMPYPPNLLSMLKSKCFDHYF